MNPTKVAVAAVAEDGALIYNSTHYAEFNTPEFIVKHLKSMLNNHGRLPSWDIIKRSYEPPTRLYYLTFKPFNKNYKRSFCAMDHVRKKIGTGHEAVIITREINATKVHYNVMVFTNEDLDSLHDQQTNKYKIWCQKSPMQDKYKIHEYVIKESHVRYFYSNRKPWANQDIYCMAKKEQN